ncbi:conserved Plasmodium protein, unknown function [Plasmodium vivax]|uniref:Cytochrome b5 heme-binding domain-containing protein n=5 Tax=Plasmodium vivax TaxID=5855 RepID=A0A0J9VTS9_PLAVI|nr:hypothetical protein PVIIG_01340 [Plasmodium vivax India VII]KMZ83751.1 hypothetical protein PVBG_00831 [Plasmodium vivax Brazil I]KMZ90953.1 hypothetical protein PVMG_04142 [Plasmodium vivax Mauritania I]KMZ97496.1 hypothetical protein PVNG_03930 [Plasmodium vivax North Korean]CAG9475775.1 unnamed protein product [Plasmodium vivax]
MEDAEQEEAEGEDVRWAGPPVRPHRMGDIKWGEEMKGSQLVCQEEGTQVEKAQPEEFPPSNEPPLVGEPPPNEPTSDSPAAPREGNEEKKCNACNACNFCEDVCFSILCARCKIKRKDLYAKYKKYKKHNLRICQKEIKLVLKLNRKARAELLSGGRREGREAGGAAKAVEGKEAVEGGDAGDAAKAVAERSSPKGEGHEGEAPQRRDQYDTLKDAIRRSKSLTNSECELEEKKMKHYNYTKYKEYFTKCEVRRHCHVNDCWVVANGYVYDVTTILSHHPGGINCILKKGGDDVSVDYSFHSKYAQKNFWEPLKIGKVITCSKEVNDLRMGSLSSKTKNKCMLM